MLRTLRAPRRMIVAGLPPPARRCAARSCADAAAAAAGGATDAPDLVKRPHQPTTLKRIQKKVQLAGDVVNALQKDKREDRKELLADAKGKLAELKTQEREKKKELLKDEKEKLKKKNLRDKAREKKREKKEMNKAAGPRSAFALFVKQEWNGRVTKDTSAPQMLKAAAEKWKALGPEDKRVFEEQAKKNKEKMQELRHKAELNKPKKPMPKYAAFSKAEFPAAYENAKKTSNTNKEAFKLASQTVAELWKKEKERLAAEAPDQKGIKDAELKNERKLRREANLGRS